MRDRHGGGRSDDWVPPAWTHPPEPSQAAPIRPRGAVFQPERARSIDIGASGAILGMAIAPAISGFFALVFGMLSLFSSAGGTMPRGMLALLIVQLAGLTAARSLKSPTLMLSWISCVLVSCLLAPVLALQVTVLREPYVSLARHSASPALFASLVAAMAVGLSAAWCIAAISHEPDRAALLFMPVAMLWPAMLGVGAVVSQRSALLAQSIVFLLCALATAICVLLPPLLRVFVPAGTLAVEFVLLWMTGHGPWFQPTSGDIVRVICVVSLVLCVILTVATPLVAMAAGAYFARRPIRLFDSWNGEDDLT
jgi:hypothetical protein